MDENTVRLHKYIDINLLYSHRLLSDKGTFSTDQPLLNSDSVYKIGPRRISPLRSSVSSYRHFTGILAYGIVFKYQSNDSISG
jgi:hypothetical protein